MRIISFILFTTLLTISKRDIRGQANDDSLYLSQIDSIFNESNSIWNVDGPFEENIRLLKQASRYAENINAWDKMIEAWIKLNTVYYYSKDKKKFNESIFYADSLASQHLDHCHFYVLVIKNKLALIQFERRNYIDAISILESILGNCPSIEKNEKARILTTIGNSYISLGDYAKAEQNLELSLELRKYSEEKDNFIWFNTHLIMSRLKRSMKQIGLSHEHARLGMEILYNINNPNDRDELQLMNVSEAAHYYNEGNEIKGDYFLNRFNQIDKPLSSYLYGKLLKAQAIKSALNKSSDQDSITCLLHESIQEMESSVSIMTSPDIIISDSFILLGDQSFDNGDLNTAEEYYQEALKKLLRGSSISEPINIRNKDLFVRILEKLFDLYVEQNNADLALERLFEIRNLLRMSRREITSQSLKDFWAREDLRLLEKFVSFSIRNNMYDLAFSLAEENKSNILIHDLLKNVSSNLSSVSDEDLVKGKRIKQEIINNSYQIYELKKSSNNSEELYRLQSEKYKAEVELENYYEQMESEYPQYYRINHSDRSVTLKEVQDIVDSKTIVLEYFVGQRNSWVFYITKSNIEVRELGLPSDLRNKTLNYYEALKDVSIIRDNELNKLNELLGLDDLDGKTNKYEKLIIVPDDFLSNIPFETIKSKNGLALIHEFSISYQYSLQLLKILLQKNKKTWKYDVVGYAYKNESHRYLAERSCVDVMNTNLLCSGLEIESIKNSLSEKNNIFLSGSANEMLEMAKSTKVLHLATHACVDENDEDYSRIYFNDEHLNHLEISSHEIPSELVVLSACETGFGKIVKGEGSMTLSKSFFNAGCSSTVVSLWPVDDCSTSKLMDYFYRNLSEGNDKSIALRNAKLTYLAEADPSRTHPYFWAGFILIGDDSSIWNSGIRNIWLLSAILVTIFMLYLLYQKSKYRSY